MLPVRKIMQLQIVVLSLNPFKSNWEKDYDVL